jgi:hypothetical protein
MATITPEALLIQAFVDTEWGHLFKTRLEVRLKELFPEPENCGLHHIWTYGTADLVILRDESPVAIIEPGGSHHWDSKQRLNDRRKWKLAEVNGVRCIHIMNGVVSGISKRQFRRMIGSVLFDHQPKTNIKVNL